MDKQEEVKEGGRRDEYGNLQNVDGFMLILSLPNLPG